MPHKLKINEFYFKEQLKRFPKYYDKMKEMNLSNCWVCKRANERNMIVPPVGNPESTVIFVGRDPGKMEEIEGIPFVRATKHGQILDDYLSILGLRREEVYITNAMFCRGTNSRVPEPQEFMSCFYWKDKEIDWNHRIIFTLGKDATRMFLGEIFDFWRARNNIFLFPAYTTIVIPLHHPGYLVRKEKRIFNEQYGELCLLSEEFKNWVSFVERKE